MLRLQNRLRTTDQQRRSEANIQLWTGVIILLIGVGLGALIFGGEAPLLFDVSGYSTNLYTELMGIGVTVFILNRLAERRALEEIKERLVRDSGSTSNEAAKAAVSELWKRGWLIGAHGLLQGSDLRRANLTDANLRHAMMENANLFRAILRDANLFDANLRRADLQEACLDGADLVDADLTGAEMGRASLYAVNLAHADLSGADLSRANLSGARLTNAILTDTILTDAIMPDGKPYTPDLDLSVYTA